MQVFACYCAFRSIATQVYGGVLGHFFAFFHIFSVFERILSHLAFLYRFLAFFLRFWEVLGGFCDAFWEVFSMIFGTHIETRDFVKSSVSLRREHEKQGFEV